MRCYLCKSKKINKLFIKNNYQLFCCLKCGLVFYDFKNDYSKFLKKQYTKGYFTGKLKLDSYFDYEKDKKNIVKNFYWYLKKILSFKKSGALLDVGCAFGYFLEIARKKGFEVFGIDPSGYAVKQAKKKFGSNIKKTSLSKISYKNRKFDVITMFDVFEHLKDPKNDLKKIGEILKDNGLLVVATGDTSSPWAKLNGKRWTFYNPPQHIFYFNKNNIKKILEESGFKIIKIMKTGKWLSVSYILHLAMTVGRSKSAQILYPFVKNNFIGRISIYLKLNDNMVIFVKKKDLIIN